MKKTITRTKEVWSACNCGGKEDCYLCKGKGKFISEITTETIIEETMESSEEVVWDLRDVQEAEEVIPKLECTKVGKCFECGTEDVVGRWTGMGVFMCRECLGRKND